MTEEKILVAGGGGLVGSHLDRHLYLQGYFVRAVDLKFDSYVKERVPEKDAIVLTMSLQTFLKAVFDGLNPHMAYLARKVKIRGVKDLVSVSKLLRVLKLADYVCVGNVDRF